MVAGAPVDFDEYFVVSWVLHAPVVFMPDFTHIVTSSSGRNRSIPASFMAPDWRFLADVVALATEKYSASLFGSTVTETACNVIQWRVRSRLALALVGRLATVRAVAAPATATYWLVHWSIDCQ